MSPTPSILLLSWNRREYFERTIRNLLDDPSDFQLYLWDNASGDGVREIIASLDDSRIAARHFSQANVGQAPAWYWFLENAKTDFIGKLDDDILGSHGWMTRFSGILAQEQRIGELAGWIFLESDWDEQLAAHKIIDVGGHRIFRNGWVPGCMFVGRRDLLTRFTFRNATRWGTPINHLGITRAGFICGFPLPMQLGVNLDDPRHPDCRMNRPGGWDEFAAYSARMRKFSGPEAYAQWIAEDARRILEMSVDEQVAWLTPPGRFRRMLNRVKGKFGLGK